MLEDLGNKSESLLQYNPVHKKVPVLVHNGKPIAESAIILEYIDDHWNYAPKLLPEDPYERAMVRFWANFIDEKILSRPLVMSEGEEKAEVIKEYIENVSVLEEGIKRDFSGKSPFFNCETPGYLDLVLGSSACSYRAIEEITGAKLIIPEIHPLFFDWVTAMKTHPVVKETIPLHEGLVNRVLQYKQQRALELSNTKA
ncbi:hypothetical protein IFM89_031280 [Coptis chinensis]|uniref:Glutathione S-transferase n=1 Tax=Coptis chinensis TaxID=261450 RepID=A0A835MB50_9MAGN|nr:hypothetical protein IFM89_031280 [Coptis chinensis]